MSQSHHRTRPTLRRNLRPGLLALLLGASLSAPLFTVTANATAATATTTVPAPQYVAAQGRVLPAGGIFGVAASSDSGTPIVHKLHVTEGQRIDKAGTPLAELSVKARLQAELAQAQAAAEAAATRWQLTQAPAQIQAVAAQQQIAAAEVALAGQAVREAEAAVRVAETSLTEAQAQTRATEEKLSGLIAENQRVLDKDSPPAREAAQIRFEQKQIDLEKQSLARGHAGTVLRLEAQIEQAKAAVVTARQRLETARLQQSAAAAEQVRFDNDAAALRQQSASATAAAEAARLRLEAAQINAPIAGTVLRINARAGEAVPPEGLLVLADLDKLCVDAEVYIDDLRHVKIGQKARITGESFAGEITATVERIGSNVELPETFTRDPAAFTDRRVVKVRLSLDGAPQELPVPLPINSRVLVRINRQ